MFLHFAAFQTAAARCRQQHSINTSCKYVETTTVFFALRVLPELVRTYDSRRVDVLDAL